MSRIESMNDASSVINEVLRRGYKNKVKIEEEIFAKNMPDESRSGEGSSGNVTKSGDINLDQKLANLTQFGHRAGAGPQDDEKILTLNPPKEKPVVTLSSKGGLEQKNIEKQISDSLKSPEVNSKEKTQVSA